MPGITGTGPPPLECLPMVSDHPTSSPPQADDASAAPAGWSRWSELFIAAALVIIGIVILVQTQDIRVVRSMSQVSPRAIPQIVGAGLIIAGAWYAIDIYRKPHVAAGGEDGEDVNAGAKTDWTVLAILAVGLTAFALLMRPAGFVIASAVLFTISSTAMGSRRHLLNAVIGIVLAAIVFLMFDTWLGVRLPAGIFEDVLQ